MQMFLWIVLVIILFLTGDAIWSKVGFKKSVQFISKYTLIFSTLAFIMWFVISGISTEFVPVKYERHYRASVVAMDDQVSYVVHRHDVSSDYKYYYKSRLSDGSYVHRRAPAEHSKVWEDSTKEDAHVNIFMVDYEPKNYYQEQVVDFVDRLVGTNNYGTTPKNKWEFHIPPGGIVRDIKIDF